MIKNSVMKIFLHHKCVAFYLIKVIELLANSKKYMTSNMSIEKDDENIKITMPHENQYVVNIHNDKHAMFINVNKPEELNNLNSLIQLNPEKLKDYVDIECIDDVSM